MREILAQRDVQRRFSLTIHRRYLGTVLHQQFAHGQIAHLSGNHECGALIGRTALHVSTGCQQVFRQFRVPTVYGVMQGRPSRCIDLGTGRNQMFDDVGFALAGGEQHGRIAIIVAAVRTGAIGNEHIDHRQIVIACRNAEQGGAIAFGGIYVQTTLQERRQHIDAPFTGGDQRVVIRTGPGEVGANQEAYKKADQWAY